MQVWDIRTGKVVQTFVGHESVRRCLKRLALTLQDINAVQCVAAVVRAR